VCGGRRDFWGLLCEGGDESLVVGALASLVAPSTTRIETSAGDTALAHEIEAVAASRLEQLIWMAAWGEACPLISCQKNDIYLSPR
jgi:hypothetical protein